MVTPGVRRRAADSRSAQNPAHDAARPCRPAHPRRRRQRRGRRGRSRRCLGREFAGGVRICPRPPGASPQREAQRRGRRPRRCRHCAADERARRRCARPLPARRRRRSCSRSAMPASVGAAARLASDGVFDDYVQHFPTPVDPRPAGDERPPRGAHRRRRRTGVAARRQPPARRAAATAHLSSSRTTRSLHALVAAMLESEQVDLVFESDGAAALDRIHAIGPDLVLMDVLLPGGDGVALTEQLKATPELAGDPGRHAHRRGATRDPGAQHGGRRGRLHRQAVHARLAGRQARPSSCRRRLSRVARARARRQARRDRNAAELPRLRRPGRARIALRIEAVQQLAPRAPARAPGWPASRGRSRGSISGTSAIARRRLELARRVSAGSSSSTRASYSVDQRALQRGAPRCGRTDRTRVPRSRLAVRQQLQRRQHPARRSATLRGAWPSSFGCDEQPAAPCRTRAATSPSNCSASCFAKLAVGVEARDLVLVLVGHQLAQLRRDGARQRQRRVARRPAPPRARARCAPARR